MNRDFILTSILKEIRDDIGGEKSLKKFKKDRTLLTSLNDEELIKLIEFIIDTQTSCIRTAFENKDSIKIDYVGKFSPSKLREFDMQFTKQYRTDNPNASEQELQEAKKIAIKKYYDTIPTVQKKVFYKS